MQVAQDDDAAWDATARFFRVLRQLTSSSLWRNAALTLADTAAASVPGQTAPAERCSREAAPQRARQQEAIPPRESALVAAAAELAIPQHGGQAS